MKRSVGEKLGRFFEDHFPDLLSFSGITGIAVLDVFDFEFVSLFVLFCGLSLFGIFLNVRRKKSNGAIQSEIETLKQALMEGNRNFYEVWDDRVRSIFQDCKLSNSDRVSIYKHDTGLDEFRLLGRYAENHAYRRKNRFLYPMDKGVIGKAWEQGEFFEKALPNPDRSYERYIEENEKKYSISRETCEGLTMKSTCLWAKSLSNVKNVPFALVVVESTKREHLDVEKLTEFFDGDKRAELENLLDSLAFMEPNLRLAKEMGF